MIALPRVWTVPATVVRVVDGDTVRLLLSLGWHTYREENCRILGVNAPETSTREGRAAKAWAADQLAPGTPAGFESHELDKYGRPLGVLWYPRPALGLVNYGEMLLAAGHAVLYRG